MLRFRNSISDSLIKEILYLRAKELASLLSVLIALLIVALTAGFLAPYLSSLTRAILLPATFVLGITVVIFFLRRERIILKRLEQFEQATNSLLDQYNDSYKLIRTYNEILIDHLHVTEITNLQLLATKEDFSNFQRLSSDILENVKKTLQAYYFSRGIDIGDDISLTIMLIISSETIVELFANELNSDEKKGIRELPYWVITAMRDKNTISRYPQREIGRIIYNIQHNTIFQRLYSNRNLYFYCNDLQALGATYSDETPNWREYYNSVFAVPIGISENSLKTIYGFLLVDSWRRDIPDLFDDDEYYILGLAAELVANIFLSLTLVKVGE